MPPPDLLYKYTSCETALVILDSGCLRWSSPSLFNDIAEFKKRPRFNPTLEEAHKNLLVPYLIDIATGKREMPTKKLSKYCQGLLSLIKMLLDSGEDAKAILDEALKEEDRNIDVMLAESIEPETTKWDSSFARVICFTECSSDNLMWAHYAANHTGIVLGFRHVPELDTPFMKAKPVRYSAGNPIIGSGLDYYLYGDHLELGRLTTEAIYYTKGPEWSYEKEWRVITWRKEEISKAYSDFKFYPEELDSICIGVRFDEDKNEEIFDLINAKYPHCSIFRMIQDGPGTICRTQITT